MSINHIQFQKGLSLDEFIAKYGDEEACKKALFNAKWSNGFQCPNCGSKSYCQLVPMQCLPSSNKLISRYYFSGY